jgi:hypothetical protein
MDGMAKPIRFLKHRQVQKLFDGHRKQGLVDGLP